MTRTLLVLGCLVLVSCDRPQASDDRQLAARALQGALIYPGSTILAISAGEDAAEVRLTTVETADRVAEWFRQALTLNGWGLKNDGKAAGGAITIYAEKKDGRPLWLTLTPNVGGPGTTYTLVGAIIEPDSTAKDTAKAKQ